MERKTFAPRRLRRRTGTCFTRCVSTSSVVVSQRQRPCKKAAAGSLRPSETPDRIVYSALAMRATPTQLPTFPTTVRPVEKLLVFARVPRLGQVKSRIGDELGHEQALRLYEAMLADLLDGVGSSNRFDVEVLWTADGEVSGEELSRCFGDRELAMQAGDDLGIRLSTAFSERILFHQAEKVIAIGTDDPTLTRHDIETAFQLLDSCEWVVGPAGDGGYYLIGCRGESFFPGVFDGIDWGSSSVFEQTHEHLRTSKRTVAMLPVRTDLDRVEDLHTFRLSERASKARRLHQILSAWKSAE